MNQVADLKVALEGLLNHYTALVNSGDCGNWDPETEPQVIAARKALKKRGYQNKLKIRRNGRGFKHATFDDAYGQTCSIQESSNVDPHIWLGVDVGLELAPGSPGYTEPAIEFRNGSRYVHRGNRMHLTPEQVRGMLPALQHFVENGVLP